MESLRDQLANLFPNLGRDEKKAIEVRNDPGPKPQASIPSNVDDWRKGVTPLAASGSARIDPGGLHGKLKLPGSKRASGGVNPRPRMSPTVSTNKATPPLRLSVHPSARPAKVTARASPSGPSALKPPAMQFGSVRPPALTRETEFKDPEPWVSAGAALQPPTGGSGPVLPVRIGIDFGTAYTKVAIRAADRVFFVPWTGVRNSSSPHFLPGEIAILRHGPVCLGRVAEAEEIRCDLKLPFLAQNINSREQFGSALAFLAWVMKYARAWLYHTHASLLQGRRLAWEVNLGCPTNSWAARDMRFSYETLGVFAWQLSQTAHSILWERTLALANSGRPSLESVGLDGLKLMPEFVAQIAGYVRSPQRKDGLHFLMDVGAGTVDMATFNVYHHKEKEEDRFPIFASHVLPLGTHFLMAERHRQLGIPDQGWDDFTAVPSADEFAARAKVDLKRVSEIDTAFADEVTRVVSKLLGYTHTRRYGKAPEWREGLPAFLSGGGSDCDVYLRSLSAAFAQHSVKLKRTSFPLLEEASKSDGVDEKGFHRLSVAYGLTFDAESIGRILAPHEIDDAPRFDPAVDTPRERPDRDELYPK